jgi:Tol biopolymer transport system component
MAAAMLLRRGLLVRTALVATLAVLLAGARPGNAAFPGTNGRIAYTCAPNGQEICVVNADGSSLGFLTQEDRSGGDYDERYPAWSPDGRRIAFVVVGFCTNAIYVMNSNRTGVHRVLLEKGERSGMWTIQDLSWSPDGTRLVYGKSFHPGHCPMELPAELKRIFTISVAGTGERQITSGSAAIGTSSPPGRRTAVRSPSTMSTSASTTGVCTS